MVANMPFLNVPYGAYLHNEVPSEDEELTHVGPGTPAGEWFRRVWLPVFVADELKDLPVAIRILGEDLVVFRDRSGRVGLLELHCSHRGTSLEFGQIEERGIRCYYHAWLYDVDGRLLETPGEPAESTIKDRLCHGAYPTHEYGGFVFAYMGPSEQRPEFPIYDTFEMAGYQSLARAGAVWPCNWLQVRENVMAPSHFIFLHGRPGNIGFSEDFSGVGELDYMETPIGMVCIDTRRLGDMVWVRVSDYVPPSMHQGCEIDRSPAERGVQPATVTTWIVPIDDTHTINVGLTRARVGEKLHRKAGFGQTMDRPYEERQRVPGDYDAQVSQRPIARHALEHLATTDRGVIMLRNMVRRSIRAVQHGEHSAGTARDGGGSIATYAQESWLRIPQGATPEEDRRLLRETGRSVVVDRIRELSKV